MRYRCVRAVHTLPSQGCFASSLSVSARPFPRLAVNRFDSSEVRFELSVGVPRFVDLSRLNASINLLWFVSSNEIRIK